MQVSEIALVFAVLANIERIIIINGTIVIVGINIMVTWGHILLRGK